MQSFLTYEMHMNIYVTKSLNKHAWNVYRLLHLEIEIFSQVTHHKRSK